MKKITKTLTVNTVTARVYNHTTDELDTKVFIKCGKIDGLEKRDGEIEILKIIDTETREEKREMGVETFMALASENEIYMHGFINRKIGGEIANIVVYNLETDEIEKMQVENATPKQIEKSLENAKLIKIESVEKVDEKFYSMSEETFRMYGDLVE